MKLYVKQIEGAAEDVMRVGVDDDAEANELIQK
eukprot:gene26265-biopygen15392